MAVTVRQIGFADADFEKCFDIRLEVFVAEQKVPLEEERDDLDPAGLHFLAELDGQPAGTARVLLQGDMAKITRVAVLKPARGQRIGEALMRHIEATLPARRYVLDGQVQAMRFYERLGYQAEGEVFLEAGIAHRHMVKEAM